MNDAHPSPCLHERNWGENKSDHEKYDRHVEDAERQGGARDRLTVVEKALETTAKEIERNRKDMNALVWKAGATGGIIGGLIGAGCPEAIRALANVFIK